MRAFFWPAVFLLHAAMVISYLDRQALPVAVQAIGKDIPISNLQFSQLQAAFLIGYAAMYVGGGTLMDRLGVRLGYCCIVIFWSLACISQGFAQGLAGLLASRLLLGVGEGGAFPGATKAVAEWFPPESRASAIGIIQAGTAVGSMLAPPLVALILYLSGWRTAFFVVGTLGLVWVCIWLADWRSEGLATQQAYWKRKLAGDLPILCLPADRQQPLGEPEPSGCAAVLAFLP